ncbi:MAG: hypothetical protein Q4C42_07515 [Clostridia bacterium]|nr:hypothetical protein [Clostridia bacterium]
MDRKKLKRKSIGRVINKGIILLVLTCICISLLLTGCTGRSSKTLGSLEVVKDNELRMSYYLFDGNKEYKHTFSEDTAVSVDIGTNEGELKVEIMSEDGDEAYSGNFTDSQQFTVNVKEGTYKFIVTGSEHFGYYCFNW